MCVQGILRSQPSLVGAHLLDEENVFLAPGSRASLRSLLLPLEHDETQQETLRHVQCRRTVLPGQRPQRRLAPVQLSAERRRLLTLSFSDTAYSGSGGQRWTFWLFTNMFSNW